jgi:hypothetical protein
MHVPYLLPIALLLGAGTTLAAPWHIDITNDDEDGLPLARVSVNGPPSVHGLLGLCTGQSAVCAIWREVRPIQAIQSNSR